MKRIALILAVLASIAFPTAVSASTRNPHEPHLSIARGRAAIVQAERRYWKGNAVRLAVGHCWSMSPIRVRCNVQVSGVFYNTVEENPQTGETSTHPGPTETVAVTDDALLTKRGIRIRPGTGYAST